MTPGQADGKGPGDKATSGAGGLLDRARAIKFLLLPIIGFLQQTLVPVALAFGVYRAAGESALLFGGLSAALVAFVALIVPLGRWLPPWLLAVPLLSLGAIPAGIARTGSPEHLIPPSDAPVDWAMAVLMWGVAAHLGRAAFHLRRGHAPLPGRPIRLAPPLGPGDYLALQAGAVRPMNLHLSTLADPSLSQLRGQAFGVDLIALHRGGVATRRPFSHRAEDYAIFGAQVVSPARSRVAGVRDGIADHDLLSTDNQAPLGNHVWLSVEDEDRHVVILLAHLRRGSLRVQEGDLVEPGTPIGEVGHSGNSTEPHLHIHAQEGASCDAPLDAEPVPMEFGALGQLVRNQRFTVPDGAAGETVARGPLKTGIDRT